MKFMGIDIDGNAQSFEQKLIEKGFEKFDYVNNCYTGRFSGHDCHIFFFLTDRSHVVYKVCAMFDDLSEDDMTTLCANLVVKYGKKESEDVFSNVKFDVFNEHLKLVIDTDEGVIMFLFLPSETAQNGGNWSLLYFDLQNDKKNKEEAFSDL